MKVRDIIKEVEAQGWRFDRQVGSHRQYVHPKLSGTITIPGQEGKDLKPKTLASIRRQARGR